MLTVMDLIQHWILSSRIIIPCDPCGASDMEHTIRIWFVVCSGVLELAIQQRSKTPYVHGQIEWPNTSQQAIELNPSY